MRPVVAEVVSGEGFHGHRVAAHDADGIRGRGGLFRSNSSPHQYPMQPVARLVYEGGQCSASTAENDGGNGYPAGRIGHLRVAGVLSGRDREPGIRMRRGSVRRIVSPSLPVLDGLALQTLPPRLIVRSERDVGEYRVATNHVVGIAIGFGIRARSDAEVSGLGID